MELERYYAGSLPVKVVICSTEMEKQYHCNIDPWESHSIWSNLPCMGIFPN